MWPTAKPAELDSAHGTWRLSMWRWEKSANPQIGIASKPHRIFGDIEYQDFLTTSSIVLWVQMLKFWSLPRIVGDRATGWAGFNWLIDLTCAGHRPESCQAICYVKNSCLCNLDEG